MKYGYVYFTVCVVIVAIGIFVIFQQESRQLEQSNSLPPVINSQNQAVNSSLAPLKQSELSMDYNVKCKQGLQLVIKNEDNLPACVKDMDISTLWDEGWISKSPAIYKKYISSDIAQKFQSEIISKDEAISIVENHIYQKYLNHTLALNFSNFIIVTSLNYEMPTSPYHYLLYVNQTTGFPTRIFPPKEISDPSFPDYYDNPRWWSELEKYYLGMQSNRIDNGSLVWHVDFHDCHNCVASYTMIMVDAISGKVIYEYYDR